MAWRTPGGQERQATLTKRARDDPHRLGHPVLDNGGARVGYIFFRNFVTPSTAALTPRSTSCSPTASPTSSWTSATTAVAW